MQDITSELINNLSGTGIGADEAKLYAELVKEPNTHLELSRKTGINRTKVYRLIADLEKKGLVMRKAFDKGMFLVAGDPGVLRMALEDEERSVFMKRQAYERLSSIVEMVQKNDQDFFAVYTYTGIDGMKQMLWHELKTQGELLMLGNFTIEGVVDDRSWAERFRLMIARQDYKTREIINRPYENLSRFSEVEEFLLTYEERLIPGHLLPINTPVAIYNDTVATYKLTSQSKFGVEIVNRAYAETMRHVFEHYWALAEKQDKV